MDRARTLKQAKAFVANQKYEKATLEYQKLLQETPEDTYILLKLGDLHIKLGHYAHALSLYARAGQLYVSEGIIPKAIAVYQQMSQIITKYLPQEKEQYLHVCSALARLYRQTGQTKEAIHFLQELANYWTNDQKIEKALPFYRELAALDPSNPFSHLRLAEALHPLNKVDEIVGHLAQATSLFLEAGQQEEALQVIERLLLYKPEPFYARTAASLYLARGRQDDTLLAIFKLQICLQAYPSDLPALQLLVEAFDRIGHNEKALAVQKEMVRIAQEQKNDELHQALLANLKQQAPHDQNVQRLISNLDGTSQASKAQVPSPPPIPSVSVSSKPPKTQTPLPIPLPSSTQPYFKIEETLDQLDSLIASGLLKEAKDLADSSFLQWPNHPLLLERLHEIETTQN
ncbi:tetratricopeptide repeat protein [Pajaroellobacter abortibovis]|uniref:MalT-like TPR region domain-containing protein n=1 Tax=Pajaroellobacter abortibovis TaxID=1882918 RepID=A0A1L6MWG5_9BACT|nr:tetratricopeptide repeat protein [Pajaroellobacter abortibovis]APR99873.1 hypothetical protein BCY86_03655 [Pajaroellobacter abortibovis]